MEIRNVILSFGVVLLLSMCRPDVPKIVEVPMPVEVKVMDTTTCVITRTYVGKSEDADVIALGFGMPGKIQKVYVHNGDKVVQGQVLVALDSTKAHSALVSASAQLRQAQDGYQRVKIVYDEGGVSEVKMMEISTRLREAEQLVKAAQSQADGCTLCAPINGVISDLNSYAGQNILPDITILKIHNRTGKSVVYSVPEQDIAQVHSGDKVQVFIPALNNQSWSGRVVERNLNANTMSHSYDVKCTLDGNTQDILPGMICKVRSQKDVVSGYMVPAHCVQTIGEGLCLWVCRDGVAKRVRIEAASFGRDGVAVEKGLRQGDCVIINGYQKLYEGQPVEIRKHEKE